MAMEAAPEAYRDGKFCTTGHAAGEMDMPEGLKRLGLYLHVPFCHNLCPYCPYHRVKFDEGSIANMNVPCTRKLTCVPGR